MSALGNFTIADGCMKVNLDLCVMGWKDTVVVSTYDMVGTQV